MQGEPTVAALLDGYVMARGGDSAGARHVRQSFDDEGALAMSALISAALGEQDTMYATFQRAIDARDPYAIWFLNAFPALRPWRQEPRYQALLGRMGLPEEWR
jgi:hypothetical protein